MENRVITPVEINFIIALYGEILNCVFEAAALGGYVAFIMDEGLWGNMCYV